MKQVSICVEDIKFVNRSPKAVIKIIKLEQEPNYMDLFIPETFRQGYRHDNGAGTVTYYPAHRILNIQVVELKGKNESVGD